MKSDILQSSRKVETHVSRLFGHAHWRNHRKIADWLLLNGSANKFSPAMMNHCKPSSHAAASSHSAVISYQPANKQSIVLSLSHISMDPPRPENKQ